MKVCQKEVVFVLGGPGSGKGTQCARVAKDFGYLHLSTGDLLREEQLKDSDLAEEIKKCIGGGQLVPSSTIVALLRAAIVKGDSERFLIDGFPRSRRNLEAWFQTFSDDDVQISFVLFLECPRDALTERLLERGKTSGRADDNLESALKRFDTFEQETVPVVTDLARMGLVRRISSLPTKDVVYHNVARVFRGSELVPPTERTLAIIKPDAVAAGKSEEIVDRWPSCNRPPEAKTDLSDACHLQCVATREVMFDSSLDRTEKGNNYRSDPADSSDVW